MMPPCNDEVTSVVESRAMLTPTQSDVDSWVISPRKTQSYSRSKAKQCVSEIAIVEEQHTLQAKQQNT